MVTPTDPPPKKAKGKIHSSKPTLWLDTQWILVDIVLGMPKRNCQYHGICRIDLDDLANDHCPHRVRASILYEHQRIHVRFWKEKISEATAHKHFASGYFVVLTDFTLPEPLQAIFQPTLVIRQGIYPLQESAEYYTVHF